MAHQSKKAIEIEKMLTPLLQASNIEIVDVEFQRENGSIMLRVFIDTDHGVGLEDCSAATAIIRQAIDPIEEYDYDYLEVSSPGLDRIIKKKEDFIRFTGEKVRVKTTEPFEFQKKFTGRLVQYTDERIIIEMDQNIFEIPTDLLDTVRLFPEI